MPLPGRQKPTAVVHTTSHPDFEWQRLDLRDAAMVEQARRAAACICDQDSRATLEHDFDWVLGGIARDGSATCIWLCQEENEVAGYAPLTIHPSRLNLCLGETALASLRIIRHTLIGCPLFAPAVREHEAQLTASLVAAIRRTLPHHGVLFLLGARADSALFASLGKRDTEIHFLIQNYGLVYLRRLICLPNSYKDYIAGLGKNTRYNMGRHHRKLLSAATEDITLGRFTTCSDVWTFLDAAIPVSRKTYQWKNLGLGLHDRPLLTRRLRAAAERGLMLCYVLYHGATPLAFQLGYKFCGVYYAHDIGFDPKWKKYSVGNLLHCRVVQDLIERHPETVCMDLHYGDGPNKERFSNSARLEGNFYLFPRTNWGTAAFLSLKVSNAMSEATGNLLLRFGLKEKIRQLLRHWKIFG